MCIFKPAWVYLTKRRNHRSPQYLPDLHTFPVLYWYRRFCRQGQGPLFLGEGVIFSQTFSCWQMLWCWDYQLATQAYHWNHWMRETRGSSFCHTATFSVCCGVVEEDSDHWHKGWKQVVGGRKSGKSFCGDYPIKHRSAPTPSLPMS